MVDITGGVSGVGSGVESCREQMLTESIIFYFDEPSVRNICLNSFVSSFPLCYFNSMLPTTAPYKILEERDQLTSVAFGTMPGITCLNN